MILSLVRFFTRRYNIRRPGGLEGVSRCIVDARKSKLTSAHTYIYKSSLMSLLPSFVLFLSSFSPTISDHRETTRSENDRFHSVLSSLFSVKLDDAEYCMYVAR